MDEKYSDLSEHFGKKAEKNGTESKPLQNKINTSDVYLSHDEEYYENIRRRMKERKINSEKRRIRRNRIIAVLVIVLLFSVIFVCCYKNGKSANKNEQITDSSKAEKVYSSAADVTKTKVNSSYENDASSKARQQVSENQVTSNGKVIEKSNGMTFVDGILIVNKTYSLPHDYNPGTSSIAQTAFDKMSQAAANEGIVLFVNSGYRSYTEQKKLYDGYVAERGTEAADEVSSRPGHSEHQTGLTFDVNSTEFSFENTPEAVWLEKHCCEYGFIIRYPKGKEKQTGFAYEPWHIRYIGVEKATAVTKSGLCLEEYLGITSDYKYCEDD